MNSYNKILKELIEKIDHILDNNNGGLTELEIHRLRNARKELVGLCKLEIKSEKSNSIVAYKSKIVEIIMSIIRNFVDFS